VILAQQLRARRRASRREEHELDASILFRGLAPREPRLLETGDDERGVGGIAAPFPREVAEVRDRVLARWREYGYAADPGPADAARRR
jgi:hypothetical protein